MRRQFYHVVTSLVPELLGKDAPLNDIAEIERRALEERRTSPRYARGKEVRREQFRILLILLFSDDLFYLRDFLLKSIEPLINNIDLFSRR